MVCGASLIYAQEVLKFEPSNYYINENGDTVLILPEDLPQIGFFEIKSDTISIKFGNDVNLTEKSGCGHPGLAVRDAGNYLYVCTETGLSNMEVYVREWKLSRSGSELRLAYSSGVGWYHTTYTIYFPAIAATSSKLMLVCDTRSGSNYYSSYSFIHDIPGLSNGTYYLLDAQSPVVTPDVACRSSTGDDFYAVAQYRYTSTDCDIRFYKTKNGGQNWNRTTLVGGWPDANYYWMPRIASDPTNYLRVGAVWIKNTYEAIQCRLSSGSGAHWSSTYTWNNLSYPDIAIHSGEVGIVAVNGSDLEIIYSFNYGSSWNRYTINPPDVVEYPAIDVTPGGMWMIVYSDNDGDVYYAWSFDISNFSASDFVQVSDGGYGVSDRPAVVEDPTHANYAIVAWKDSRSSTDIYGDCEDGNMVDIKEKLSFKHPKDFTLPSITSKWLSFLKDRGNLSVYSLNGRKIKGLSPKTGIYFLNLKDKEKTRKQKVIFIK